MTFWTARNIATQKPFNFYVEFVIDDITYVAWEVKSVQLPTFGQEIITDEYGDIRETTEGVKIWNSFKIELYDLVGITYTEENGIKGFWEVKNSKASTAFTISQWISSEEGNFAGHAVIPGAGQFDSISNRWGITTKPTQVNIYKIYTNKKLPSDKPNESSKYVNKWTITRPILEQVDFGQLDYSSEEPMIISITMKPEQGEGSVIVTTETIK